MAHHEQEVVNAATLQGFVTHQKTSDVEGHRHSWVAVNGSMTTIDHDHYHYVEVYGNGVVKIMEDGDPLHTHDPE